MPTVVVFNTLEEANTLQNRDYLQAKADMNDPTMESWDIPRQKLNGDWTYAVYPPADYTGHTLEEYREENYLQE
jgi:hypothetical protein